MCPQGIKTVILPHLFTILLYFIFEMSQYNSHAQLSSLKFQRLQGINILPYFKGNISWDSPFSMTLIIGLLCIILLPWNSILPIPAFLSISYKWDCEIKCLSCLKPRRSIMWTNWTFSSSATYSLLWPLSYVPFWQSTSCVLFDLFLFVSLAWQEEERCLVFENSYSHSDTLLINVLWLWVDDYFSRSALFSLHFSVFLG